MEEVFSGYRQKIYILYFFQSWELPVISRLDWHLDFVTVTDLAVRILATTADEPITDGQSRQMTDRQKEIDDCELVCSLCLRSGGFLRRRGDKCAAAAVMGLVKAPLASEVLRILRLTDKEVKDCRAEMESLLWCQLREEQEKRSSPALSSNSSANSSPVTPPASGASALTKLSSKHLLSSSTPKKTPLVPKRTTKKRRALLSKSPDQSETIPEEEDKENARQDDSGMFNTSRLSSASSNSSTPKSSRDSKSSSPDSGASSNSPNSNVVEELGQVLRDTKLSPTMQENKL